MIKKVRMPAGSMISSLGGILLFGIVGALIAGLCCLIPTVGWFLGFGIACLCGTFIFFYPIAEAANIGDRLAELKKLKKTESDLKDLKVRHQYFWVIVIVNILFGVTFIGWVVAYVMAHMPCDADLSSDVAERIGS